MTPVEYARFLDDSSNRYSGIGVGVATDQETGGIMVRYVYRSSPAEAAGVNAGDVITAVDGISVIGCDISELRTLLARPVGDTVDLSVLRPGGYVRVITVEYNVIFTDPVSYEMLDSGVGYVAIKNFEQDAALSLISAVEGLIESGARAFIFDVRGNGGGRVSELTAILDFILPEGDIFVAVDRHGTETITRSDPESIDLPMVVLVDRYSFSAAEYFAATLREFGRADIVGEQTTGKSRMQTTIALPGGGALHISTDQYLTKNRISLYDVGGVVPDHVVTLTEEEFAQRISGNLNKDQDPQLQMALLVLTKHENSSIIH